MGHPTSLEKDDFEPIRIDRIFLNQSSLLLIFASDYLEDLAV
jgi:hypothetical protein